MTVQLERTGMQLGSPPSHLDFDDAFADGEDDESDYKFTSDAIRQDIARHELSWANTEASVDSEQDHSFDVESVSTLDMNGHSPSSSPHLQPALDEDEMAGEFSQISLSESVQEEPLDVVQAEPVDDAAVSNNHPYPNVVIDVSQPPTHRVTMSWTSGLEGSSSRAPVDSPSPPRPASVGSSHSEAPASSPSNASGSLPAAASSSQSIPRTPPPVPVPLPSQNPTHRPIRSTGPSALEKVRSKTRPHFLPPKSRQEDNKHLSEWEQMMKQSRATAEKRRRAFQERRLAREKKIEDSLSVWEKEIVPDWKVVHKKPALRKLWWEGIPTKLRASMWANAVGNALALSKDNYRTCLARAKRALGSGSFPSATLSLIEQDISTTLPSLHIFHQETGPLYSDLKDMMCAWVVSRSDEGLGYTIGAAKIAAMLLINMPVQQAFIVMRNLMERHCMRSFFGGEGSKDDVSVELFRDILTILTNTGGRIL
ncbi:rab-GTPase-TBC domain-containing protein [Mycena capillaripes]|nr:rab-GTPase-TBC domain-containing protein [Mycena capillaripes]